MHDKAWTGWRVIDGILLTDAGVRATPADIRALPWLWAIRAELLKKDRDPKVRPMAAAQLGEHRNSLIGSTSVTIESEQKNDRPNKNQLHLRLTSVELQ